MLAQERWRKLNGAHLLPLVRARVQFVDGVQTERRTHEENRKEPPDACSTDPQLLTISRS
jgi:hypothetical protein